MLLLAVFGTVLNHDDENFMARLWPRSLVGTSFTEVVCGYQGITSEAVGLVAKAAATTVKESGAHCEGDEGVAVEARERGVAVARGAATDRDPVHPVMYPGTDCERTLIEREPFKTGLTTGKVREVKVKEVKVKEVKVREVTVAKDAAANRDPVHRVMAMFAGTSCERTISLPEPISTG